MIEPAFARHRIVLEHGLPVAELTEPAQPLTAAQVRRSVRALRERRMK